MHGRIVAEADPIRRLKEAAQRAEGSTSIETQRDRYYRDLENDLGRDPMGRRYHADPDGGGLWPAAIGMGVLAILIFVLTAGVMMWRNGALDRFFPSTIQPKAPAAPKWVLGDQETGLPSPIPTGKAAKDDAPPNLIEPPLPPQPTAEPEPERQAVSVSSEQ